MNTEHKVAALLEAIRGRDSELGAELQAKREGREVQEKAQRFKPVLESAVEGREAPRPQLALETIVLRTGRPVLAVSRDEPQLTFSDAESEIWRDRLAKARSKLNPAIRAVGRVELKNNPRFDWVGTGWLVQPDVIVTNRHVALEFGRRSGDTFVFRPGIGGSAMSASVDFLEEIGRDESRSFLLAEILDIEDEDGPDLAFLRIKGDGLAKQITLSSKNANEKQMVAVIGYPARDSRIPDQQLMETIFGDVYDKKRLAPGQITRSAQDDLEHDCSTLGGNSGSVVLDLATGEALGIHFAGRFLETNFAVPASTIAERLNAAITGEARRRPISGSIQASATAQAASSSSNTALANASVTSVTCTIPIKVTVEIGTAYQGTSPGAPAISLAGAEEVDVPVTEGLREDYRDREGYKGDFLGEDNAVPLPMVVRDADQVVEFDFEDKKEHVLRYEHFSVMMNRKRRMCFFSAVNIDGKLSRKSTRTTWRIDPRIAKGLQIMYECYGNPPKFSRGHMTRREDPVWGRPKEAALGNSDSMHVTNVTPQMQSFNAPIWLGLEDYALQNARQDKMKISVITGPVLLDKDPVKYGVKIPRSFWKVIVFTHDQTGELTATGYSISQVDQMREEEFVFGAYAVYQRSLSWIEERAGISFGSLKKHDPLVRGVEGVPASLADFDQIRFVV
jgi:endonuclease G